MTPNGPTLFQVDQELRHAGLFINRPNANAQTTQSLWTRFDSFLTDLKTPMGEELRAAFLDRTKGASDIAVRQAILTQLGTTAASLHIIMAVNGFNHTYFDMQQQTYGVKVDGMSSNNEPRDYSSGAYDVFQRYDGPAVGIEWELVNNQSLAKAWDWRKFDSYLCNRTFRGAKFSVNGGQMMGHCVTKKEGTSLEVLTAAVSSRVQPDTRYAIGQTLVRYLLGQLQPSAQGRCEDIKNRIYETHA